jgi:hypothetical protein
MLFNNITVVETMEEEAVELCYAGKHSFFVEPFEEFLTSMPLRSSWTAKGA